MLPIKTIRIAKDGASLRLAGPKVVSENALHLPTAQIVAVRFRLLEAELARQWDELRNQKLAADALAVLKKDGKSLDYGEGVIGDVSDNKVEFKLEGQTEHIDRAKIAGLIYYRPDRRTKEEARAALHCRSGLRLSVAHVELKVSQLEVSTAAGAKVTWPLD